MNSSGRGSNITGDGNHSPPPPPPPPACEKGCYIEHAAGLSELPVMFPNSDVIIILLPAFSGLMIWKSLTRVNSQSGTSLLNRRWITYYGCY